MIIPPAVKKTDTQNFQKNNDWRLFLYLLPYARNHGRLLLLSILLLLPIALANAFQPLLIGQVISLILQEPTTYGFLINLPLLKGLFILQFSLLIILTIRLLLTGLQAYLVQVIGQYITAEIRQDLFDHVMSLAISFFDCTPTGKIITRLTSDVEILGNVFSNGAIGIFSDSFSMVIIVGFMFSIQWQMALLLLLILVPISVVIIFFQKRYRHSNYKSREELSILNSLLQENVVGISIIQLFRREQFNSQLFRKTNQRYVRELDTTIFYDSAISATLEWVAIVAITGVLWVGGSLLITNSLTFGILSTFVFYAQKLFQPLQQFAEKFTVLQGGLTAMERVINILDEPIQIPDNANPRFSIFDSQLGYIDEIVTNMEFDDNWHMGEIQFENVWFAYKNNNYVIKGLDFIIKPGEKIAFVGPTGAGKSTITNLLCRLYEPNKGRILLDGVDIREIPQAELRRYMAVIFQDGFLFAGDVKSNITLGDSYTIEEVKQAAENTNIVSFIEQLPEGYDTPIREIGTNLSGGQKQLLAFARAAIRNPQILVLDEATASLDACTEALVQQALKKLLQKRTAIIIAHRLSTIRNADRIFVLKCGELIEQGNHEQLIRKEGFYNTLYNLQMLGK